MYRSEPYNTEGKENQALNKIPIVGGKAEIATSSFKQLVCEKKGGPKTKEENSLASSLYDDIGSEEDRNDFIAESKALEKYENKMAAKEEVPSGKVARIKHNFQKSNQDAHIRSIREIGRASCRERVLLIV